MSQPRKPKTAVSRSPVGRAGGRSWRRGGEGSSTVPKTAMPHSLRRPVGGAAGAQGERGTGGGASHSQKPRCPAAKGGSQGARLGSWLWGGDVTRGSPSALPHCAHRQRWGFRDRAHRLRWDFSASIHRRAHNLRSPTCVCMCVQSFGRRARRYPCTSSPPRPKRACRGRSCGMAGKGGGVPIPKATVSRSPKGLAGGVVGAPAGGRGRGGGRGGPKGAKNHDVPQAKVACGGRSWRTGGGGGFPFPFTRSPRAARRTAMAQSRMARRSAIRVAPDPGPPRRCRRLR